MAGFDVERGFGDIEIISKQGQQGGVSSAVVGLFSNKNSEGAVGIFNDERAFFRAGFDENRDSIHGDIIANYEVMRETN